MAFFCKFKLVVYCVYYFLAFFFVIEIELSVERIFIHDYDSYIFWAINMIALRFILAAKLYELVEFLNI